MPRKNHYRKTQNKFNMMLRSDKKNINEIKHTVKKLIKECRAFLLRQLYNKKISPNNYELENTKLNELETQVESLISKATQLENGKILYQTENNELKEELQRIANRYEDNKTKLERYYNVIQKTYSVLQETCAIQNLYYNFPDPNSLLDIRQLADLCKEIKEICEGREDVVSGPNIPIYNSFEDALNASEPKIVEIVEENGEDREQTFPSLARAPHFYENPKDVNDQEFDISKFSF
ncbi:1320_t:CDS:2 [Racocetra fulgida]|uniref:1320_t:CDS:1 n=1 Tax=Racocetra fulgida TaxID=60492 RepID=A0A9N9DBY3_9GLOM|nr:1320_t:CDS:2 [Racocetra fulgida]